MESTQLSIVLTKRDRFLKTLRDELAKFEARENEFLRQDRKQRAAEMGLPLREAGSE
ncbi:MULTISPECIES: hypothetical protein [unclassified Bradyrhizobium]|nr:MULTISPECIES: hypothetical protein [unclassified Bradyrhizobium]